MVEKRSELMIRIGKTSGYTPEDPVDPRLAIEIAHCLSTGSNDFTVALGEWYANCTTKIADDRIVINICQRTGYQGLEVPNDRTKTYICKDCGSILKHATTSQGKHVLVSPKCDPPSIVAMKDDPPAKPDVHPGIECLGSKIPVGSEDEQKCLSCIRQFQEERTFKDLSFNAPCCLCEDVLEIQKRKALACPVWKKYQEKLPPNFYVTYDSRRKYKVVAVKTLDYGELQIPADCIHVIPKLGIKSNKVEKYRLLYLPDPNTGLVDEFTVDVSVDEGKRLSKIETDFIYHPEKYKH